MAFNYKNYAKTPSDKIMYSWIGESIQNPLWVQGAHDPSYSDFNPDTYYYYKPTSLALNITEFKDAFYQAVNVSPSNIGYMGNQPGNIAGKIWQANPDGLVNESKIDQIVGQWSNVFNINNVNKNITFSYVSAGYLLSADGLQSSGRTYLGGGAHANDYVIFIASNYTYTGSNASTNDLSVGTWGGWTVMHELGHVFGFAHPDPLYQDLRITIMAYPVGGFASNKIPLTPGIDDIKAMQIKYGLSDTQDGDTNYVFTQSSIDLGHGNILANVQTNVNINKYVLTLSDRAGNDGGIDTIDASALVTNVYINLNDGEFSAIGTDWNEAPTTGNNYNGKGDLDGDTKFNVGIAVSAEIENARGGSGNDYLKGNDLANTLEGNGGADTLEGGAGNDVLKGGSGNDTYKLDGTYGIDTIEDSGGDGLIKIDGATIPSSGNNLVLESIYINEATGYSYIKVNGGADLLVLNGPNRIIIKNWAAGNLGINLTETLPTAPTGNVMNGDFKKKINDNGTPADTSDDTYLFDANGNYQQDVAELNALDLITGTGGNDVIKGLGGDDALSGGDGDDYLDGGIGSDVLQGGLGSDTLIGGSGDDFIYGSSNEALSPPTDVNFTKPVFDVGYPIHIATGFNWLVQSNGATFQNGVPQVVGDYSRNRIEETTGNLIDAGDGNDFIAAGTGADYVHGGANMDFIFGMDKDDIILGDGGNDIIYGDGNLQGNNSVVWTLAANHGNDIIDGGDGDDAIYGQGGDDIIFGGADADHIWGDDPEYYTDLSGDDYLFGGAGNDQVVGGKGKDYIDGGTENDILYGDEGDDTLIGGLGADALIGGADADTIYVNTKEGDQLGGTQDKEDRIYYDITQSEIQNTTAETNANGDLTGKVFINLNAGGSSQVTNGLTGSSDYTYTFTDGKQILHSELMGTTLNSAVNISSADKALFGGKLDDYLVSTGTANSTLFGGLGADTLIGNDGNNSLNAGAGNDGLEGGVGNDTFDGGAGNDTLLGGLGSDVYIFGLGSGQDIVYDYQYTTYDYIDNAQSYASYVFQTTPGEVDTVQMGVGITASQIVMDFVGSDVRLTVAGTADSITLHSWQFTLPPGGYGGIYDECLTIERVVFADGTVWNMQNQDFAHSFATTELADAIQGSVFSDTINGLGGNDTLYGYGGNDNLSGGAGSDTLYGGYGNDTLDGGAGDDYLAGYDGADTIVFGRGSGMDILVSNTAEHSNGHIFSDIIQLGPDITANEVVFSRKFALDLVLTIVGTTDSLCISEYFRGEWYDYPDSSNATINTSIIRFADGSVWTYENVKAYFTATNLNDVLEGTLSGDLIHALAGNDSVYGADGADPVLSTGGELSNMSNSATAADATSNTTYQIQNAILANVNVAGGINDVVNFGADVTSNQARYTRLTNDDLLITLSTSAEIIIKQHYAADNTHRIESIQFADATIDTTILNNLLPTIALASQGNDTLLGTIGNDQLAGLAGNDTLKGGAGNDANWRLAA